MLDNNKLNFRKRIKEEMIKNKEVVVPKKKRRLMPVKKKEPIPNDPNEAMLHVIQVQCFYYKPNWPF